MLTSKDPQERASGTWLLADVLCHDDLESEPLAASAVAPLVTFVLGQFKSTPAFGHATKCLHRLLVTDAIAALQIPSVVDAVFAGYSVQRFPQSKRKVEITCATLWIILATLAEQYGAGNVL